MEVSLTAVDLETTRVDLTTTSNHPACGWSAAAGLLTDIFIDVGALGLPGVNHLTVGAGSIAFLRPVCQARATNGTLLCGGEAVPALDGTPFSLGLSLDPPLQWNASGATTPLGFFFLSYSGGLNTNSPTYNLLGWRLGFLHKSVQVTLDNPTAVTSLMLGRVYNASRAETVVPCASNIISTRVPTGDNQTGSFQVCSQVTVKQTSDQGLLEVCLSVTAGVPQCANSPAQGELRAFFLSLQGFATTGSLNLASNDLRLVQPFCDRGAAATVSACEGFNMMGLSPPLPYDIAARVDGAAWSGDSASELGCFSITSTSALTFSAPMSGWPVGFYYRSTVVNSVGISRMAGRLCETSIGLTSYGTPICNAVTLTKPFPSWFPKPVPCTIVEASLVEKNVLRIHHDLQASRHARRADRRLPQVQCAGGQRPTCAVG
jgi:hypothetical protein